MVINRKELIEECKSSKKNLADVLQEQLWFVNPEESERQFDKEVDQDKIIKQREELLNGGFGEIEEECDVDNDTDLAEAFFTRVAKKHYIIHVATGLLVNGEEAKEVFAIGREDTENYYVFESNDELKDVPSNKFCNTVGLIVSNTIYEKLQNQEVIFEGYDFYGTCVNGAWMFYKTDEERSYMTLMMFDLITNLYSRNTGLLESKIMLNKRVLIAGAGSVGSLIALELARAGVGYFVLADKDVLEIHNICRHQLGWKDVGRYKVDAVKDAILNINPKAKVDVFHGYLQDLPKEYAEDVDMIIGTGDNREANAFANDLATVLNVPFVNTGCWQRAHAGEVFYWYPELDLPLYRKAFSQLISDDRAASHANYFADDGDENHLNFEPGVSTDIAFVTMVAIKVIYDLLNKDEEGYTPRVLDYLRNYTLVCNTNKACIGGPNAEMFPNPLFISNNLVVGG